MTKQFKPEKARDWEENRLTEPRLLWIQPKIDGVRSLNRDGRFLARTLKPHANKHITALFSIPELHGMDGELYLDNPQGATNPDLCRITTSAINRINGEPSVTWVVFNYITDEIAHLSYRERMILLNKKIEELVGHGIIGVCGLNIRSIFSNEVNNLDEINEADDMHLRFGYEGSILRDPETLYKYGRSDLKLQCWRIKRFIEEEFLITGFTEGNKNNNEATVNELGRTERSSHKENMEPNGMIGSFQGVTIKDIFDPNSKKLLIPKGTEITVSAGEIPLEQRKEWFENPSLFLNKYGKFKLFPKGIKDKPRFPTFVSLVDSNWTVEDTVD